MKRLPGGFIYAFVLALAVCSPAYAKLLTVTVTVMQRGNTDAFAGTPSTEDRAVSMSAGLFGSSPRTLL